MSEHDKHACRIAARIVRRMRFFILAEHLDRLGGMDDE